MSATKEFTLKEVTEHNTKKDLYMVLHEKVYDVSSFVDEHPYVPRLAWSVSAVENCDVSMSDREIVTDTPQSDDPADSLTVSPQIHEYKLIWFQWW